MYIDKQLIINVLSSFILVIFIIYLIHKGHKKISNNILAFFFITQFLGILSGIPFLYLEYFKNNYPDLFFIGMPAALLWAPSLYLYVCSLTNNEFLKNKLHLIHFTPYVFYVGFFILNFHLLSKNEKISNFYSVSGSPLVQHLNDIINIQVVIYNLLSLLTLYRYKKRGLDQSSSVNNKSILWMSYIVYGYVIACFFDDLVIKYLKNIVQFDYMFFSAIIFLIFYTILFYKGITSQDVFLVSIKSLKYKNSLVNKQEAFKLLQILDEYIETEKPQYRTSLTITELARETKIQERHLSQIINEYKKQNFYDFINSLRITEAKSLLGNPVNKLNILQILYEVGFNSKTAFNRAFKKETGFTPSDYKKLLK